MAVAQGTVAFGHGPGGRRLQANSDFNLKLQAESKQAAYTEHTDSISAKHTPREHACQCAERTRRHRVRTRVGGGEGSRGEFDGSQKVWLGLHFHLSRSLDNLSSKLDSLDSTTGSVSHGNPRHPVWRPTGSPGGQA